MAAWREALGRVWGKLLRPGFVRDLCWYGGVNGIQALIPLGLLPLFTRTVSPQQYGLYGFFIAVAWLVHPFVRLGLDSAVLRRSFDLPMERLGEYLGTVLLLCFGMGFLLAGGAWLLPDVGGWLLRGAVEEGVAAGGVLLHWLELVIVIALLENVLHILRMFAIARGRRVSYAVMSLGQRLLLAALAIWWVVLGGGQARGLLLSQLGSFILPVLLGLVWLRWAGYLRPAMKLGDVSHGLKHGLPLVLQVFALNMIQYADRFFLKTMVGLEALGVYVAGTQVALAFFIVAASVQSLWHPWALARLAGHDPASLQRLKSALLLLCTAFLLLALIAAALLPLLTKWLTPGVFSQASTVVPWLVIAHAAHGFYLICSVFLLHQERTLSAASIAMVAFLINLALNYPFILQRGILGAAQATLLAQIAAALLCALLVFKNGWNKATSSLTP